MLTKIRGFTIYELVIVTLLLGIISVVLGRILFHSYQSYLTSQYINNADWNGLLAINIFTNDIHQIRSPVDITTASANQLSFIGVDGTNIQYQISGTSLLRNSTLLATGVNSLSFTYLNKDGTVTATPSAIRYVRINLNILQGNVQLPFSTLVGVRGT